MDNLKNVFLTGGSGFIGKYILKELSKKKVRINATYFKNKIKKTKYIKPVCIDLNQINKKKIKIHKIENLVHLAWPDLENYHDSSHKNVILENQKKLIFYAVSNGCKNLIVAGTCYEYGLTSGKISENFDCHPVCNYGHGKNSLRKYIQKLQKQFDFNFTWLRIFYIYGINPNRDTLTNILLKNRNKKKPIILNKRIKRDYVDINFVAKVFVKILQKKENFGIVNLSSGNKISLKQFVKFLSKKYKKTLYAKFQDTQQRQFEPEIFYGDNRKLMRILK
jgi:nucleoside-diphosphate-sugar epimerase